MSRIKLANVRMTRLGLASGERMGSGFLLDELEEVRGLVEKDSPDATPLLSAIDETLDGNNVYDSVPKNSKRLIAATGPDRNQAIEGLMYTEGSDFDSSVFSLANVCIWISNEGRFIKDAKHLFNHRIREPRRQEIRSKFYDLGLGNWDNLPPNNTKGIPPAKIFWGLPVKSTTRVTTVAPQEGDIDVDFDYGDWRDILAIAGLDVPKPLRSQIMQSVLGYHATEKLVSASTLES